MNTLYILLGNYCQLRYADLNSRSVYPVRFVSSAYLVMGRRGPLRVRALVFVRCPRSGKPRR